VQIDLILDPRLPPGEFLRLGRLAEAAGVGTVWTSSLLGARDPFVNLAALAAATSRLRVGAIAVNPWEAHPARIAMALLTLNEIAGGRATIVIGGGGEALAGLGLAPRRRVRAVRECVEILRRASTGARFDYAGELYRVSGFGCAWAVAPPPAVWIGANGPQMLRMAANAADGIMMSDLPPPLVRAALASVAAARAAGGAAAAAAPAAFSNFTAWHVYADRDAAVAEARQWLAFRGMFRREVCTTFISDADYDLVESKQAEFYRAALGGPPVQGVPGRVIDALLENLTICGTLAEMPRHLAHLRALRDAGLTHVALRLYRDVEASIAMIGREVVPALG
jgi:alkanesulfonate monooxygenase SsuD/methylene tetrahydromethanopterin reductase-like flavin-dependent oxidoreductase (luciferase family)